MNKNVEGVGLQTESASQLPLRGNGWLASQRRFIPTVTAGSSRAALHEQEEKCRFSQRPYRALEFILPLSQGGASLALGYSHRLPAGGKTARSSLATRYSLLATSYLLLATCYELRATRYERREPFALDDSALKVPWN
jgi:hypothetical protein